jgi:hypothetical protein
MVALSAAAAAAPAMLTCGWHHQHMPLPNDGQAHQHILLLKGERLHSFPQASPAAENKKSEHHEL